MGFTAFGHSNFCVVVGPSVSSVGSEGWVGLGYEAWR